MNLSHVFSGLRSITVSIVCLFLLWSIAGADTFSVAPFHKIKADPAPQEVLGAHYVISNELNHHIFRGRIKDPGGTLVGSGLL